MSEYLISKIFKEEQKVGTKHFPIYGVGNGSFSITKLQSAGDTIEIKPVKWHGCRETFSSDFDNGINSFVTSTPTYLNIKNFQNFFKEIEDRLELSPRERAKFKQVVEERASCTYVLVIPGSFWKKSILRRQLLTILLRCAPNYKGDNFEEALFSHPYARATREAILRFLQGYTALAFSFSIGRGWYECFRKRPDGYGYPQSESSIAERKLTKPFSLKRLLKME